MEPRSFKGFTWEQGFSKYASEYVGSSLKFLLAAGFSRLGAVIGKNSSEGHPTSFGYIQGRTGACGMGMEHELLHPSNPI